MNFRLSAYGKITRGRWTRLSLGWWWKKVYINFFPVCTPLVCYYTHVTQWKGIYFSGARRNRPGDARNSLISWTAAAELRVTFDRGWCCRCCVLNMQRSPIPTVYFRSRLCPSNSFCNCNWHGGSSGKCSHHFLSFFFTCQWSQINNSAWKKWSARTNECKKEPNPAIVIMVQLSLPFFQYNFQWNIWNLSGWNSPIYNQ